MTIFHLREPLSLLGLGLRLYLGVLFLTACWHKILDPGAFAVDIATYQILPVVLVNPMAILLPWTELFAGVMLVVGFKTRAAALLVTLMMSIFTLALVIAVARGLDMSCGCFASQGMVDDPISWSTVARDLTWLAMALFVYLYDRNPLGLDRLLSRRPNVQTQGGPA
jgi:putative oxidoreductase